jgi:peptidoglycan/LPS O-acetylase OafA/YrhL
LHVWEIGGFAGHGAPRILPPCLVCSHLSLLTLVVHSPIYKDIPWWSVVYIGLLSWGICDRQQDSDG